MRTSDLEAANAKAISAARSSRGALGPKTVHNRALHHARRDHPYFGFVDVRAGGSDVVMFSNNDDIVAQTYFWFGPDAYEEASLNLFAAFAASASVVLDVGAFTGLYSLVAASVSRTARIVAFEPSRATWERAKINAVANKFGKRIDLRDKALGSRRDVAELKHYRPSLVLQAGASLVDKANKEVFSTEYIAVVKASEELAELPPIDLVKIDVEGFEADLVEELEGRIVTDRPVIVIEIEPSNIDRCTNFFGRIGYVLEQVDDLRNAVRTRTYTADAVMNYVAYPQERLSAVRDQMRRTGLKVEGDA